MVPDVRRPAVLTVLLALVPASIPLVAQDPTPARQLDSLITLVPLRSREAIEADLRRAQEEETAAVSVIDATIALRARAEGLRKLLETEIEAIKQRISLAKQEKREVDQKGLEIERSAAELGKKLLEEREALRKAEVEVGEARRERARAAVRAARLELELLDRRAEHDAEGGGGIRAGRLGQVVQKLETEILEAFRDLARRERDLADKSLRVVERQLRLHQAQTKLSSGS